MQRNFHALLLSAALIISVSDLAQAKSTPRPRPPFPGGGNDLVLSKESTPEPGDYPSPECKENEGATVDENGKTICIPVSGSLFLSDNKSADPETEPTPIYPGLPPAPKFIAGVTEPVDPSFDHRGSGRLHDQTTNGSCTPSNPLNCPSDPQLVPTVPSLSFLI